MKRLTIVLAAAALIGGSGMSLAQVQTQTDADHQQHHPGSDPTQAQPAPSAPAPSTSAPAPQAAPAQPAPAAPPQAQAPGQGGMMQMMPEQCRAMMQNMPQDCMAAMQRMMQGGQGMMGPGMMGQGGMGQGGTGPGSVSGMPAQGAAQPESTRDYMEAMARMNRSMPMNATGNADVDFVRMMIPHHQAAIDMAKAVQKHGKDEQTKKWAAEIISSQEREVAEMTDWLKKHGH